jgi:hypothetical protein
MDRKRKVYAPFSQTSEAGVAQTPVEGYIGVNQTIYPSVDTGVIDEKGIWRGVKADDSEFIGITKAVAIPNTGEVLFPDTNDFPNIDMTGFKSLFIAFKTTRGGDYKITANMGPDTKRFANLQPVNAGALLKGSNSLEGQGDDLNSLLSDNAQTLTADVWDIFIINNSLQSQKNLQIKIVNNAGGNADIEFAFMRLV